MCAGRGRVMQWMMRLTTGQKIPGVLSVKHTLDLLHTQGAADSLPSPLTTQYPVRSSDLDLGGEAFVANILGSSITAQKQKMECAFIQITFSDF
ncbi:hypothetical protein ACTXT7_006369 [Hymenolepis weldensis]